jgi:Phage tail tube protein
MNRDPGLFFPEVMAGVRDSQFFPLYGQEKDIGAVGAPLFPSNGLLILCAAIGHDGGSAAATAGGYGVVGTPTSPPHTSTISAPITAGASTFSITSAAGITPNVTIIQVDVNAPSGSPVTTSECRLVTNVSGTTITVGTAFNYNHLSAAPTATVIAPFTHTITESVVAPSLTMEKNLGNTQSLQFAGCRINKFALKGQATDSAADFTADIVAQSVAILDSPSAVTFVDETPFVFSEFTLSWDGHTLSQATNFDLNIDNGVKAIYTMNGYHQLQFAPALKVIANGTFDVVWDSLDDATYGYFSQITDGTEGALSFSLTHPTGPGPGGAFNTGYSVELVMPLARLGKDTIDPKAGDVISEVVNYEARRSLSTAGIAAGTIYAIVNNQTYLPIG